MFDKSEITKQAHEAAKSCYNSSFYKGWSYARIFAGQLRRIWSKTKHANAAVKRAALALHRTKADNIRETILVLECKDRWTQADHARYSALMQD